MSTLVIHAPGQKTKGEGKRSFDRTFKEGIGDEYAIPQRLVHQLTPGCKVVLLSKDEHKRAEGRLAKLVEKGKTMKGIRRYDVHIEDLRMVVFKSESLRRTGIAIL